MTSKQGDTVDTVVSLNPSDFRHTELHELSFEDALQWGSKLSTEIDRDDWIETSVRFCVDGLFRWLDDFSTETGTTSTFHMIRDAMWMWLSYCDNKSEWIDLKRIHRRIAKEITHNSPYTDLVDALSDKEWLRSLGRSGRPTNIQIPRKVRKQLSEYCDAVGVSFPAFYSIGLAWCLSHNSKELYQSWVNKKVTPVLTELDSLVEQRKAKFLELENTYKYRLSQNTDVNT